MFSRRRKKIKIATPTIAQPGCFAPGGVMVSLVILVLLAAAGFFGWKYYENTAEMDPLLMMAGSGDAGVSLLQQEIKVQRMRIEELEGERSKLRQNIVDLERRSQIDQEALKQAREELKGFQSERLQLQEEVEFMKEIVSTGKTKAVKLRIQNFRLVKGEAEEQVSYRFTVSKTPSESGVDTGIAAGRVWLTFDGTKDGEEHTVALQEVTVEGLPSVKMRFRNFQNVEGSIQLPQGFSPAGVTVEVKPESNNFAPLKQRFNWVIAG